MSNDTNVKEEAEPRRDLLDWYNEEAEPWSPTEPPHQRRALPVEEDEPSCAKEEAGPWSATEPPHQRRACILVEEAPLGGCSEEAGPWSATEPPHQRRACIPVEEDEPSCAKEEAEPWSATEPPHQRRASILVEQARWGGRSEEAGPWSATEPPHRRRACIPVVPREGATPEQALLDKAWINTLGKKVRDAHPRFHPPNYQHTIFRAPDILCGSNRAAYEPSVVRIGPLSGFPNPALEECKWRFLRCLLSRCRNGDDASRIFEDCLMGMKAVDEKVRSCYSVDLGYIDPCSLATTMLLDGCFIIYLLLRRQEEDGDVCRVVTSPERRLGTLIAEQGTSNLMEEYVVMDVTSEVQKSRIEKQETGKGKFMNVSESDSKSGSGSGSGTGTAPQLVELEIDGTETFDGSLLGYLWTWNLIVHDLLKLENQIPFFVVKLIYDKLFKTSSDDPANVDRRLVDLALNLFKDIRPKKSRRFRTMPPSEIHHLLHLFHSSIVAPRKGSQPVAPATMQEARTTSPQWIPNATELAMAGVKFKRKEVFDSFLDVSFRNGVLEMPRLKIYSYTNSLFRNLIAFEQCFPDTNTDITIYANFMDCIIDTANDASLLNMKGILINRLSTDDEVASLFNQLSYQVRYDPKKNYLKNLFAEVTKYHESKWHQWRAGLVRDYFSNPWVIISVLAAVLLLLLTIEQSFFTAFSYFRPPTS